MRSLRSHDAAARRRLTKTLDIQSCRLHILIIAVFLSGCEVEVDRERVFETMSREEWQVFYLNKPVAICSESIEFIDRQQELLNSNGYEPIRVTRETQQCLYLEKKQADSASSIPGVAF